MNTIKKRLIKKADNIYENAKKGIKEFKELAQSLNWDSYEEDGIVCVYYKNFDETEVTINGETNTYQNVSFYVGVNYEDVNNASYEAGAEIDGKTYWKEFNDAKTMIDSMKNPSKVDLQ